MRNRITLFQLRVLKFYTVIKVFVVNCHHKEKYTRYRKAIPTSEIKVEPQQSLVRNMSKVLKLLIKY